MLITDSYSSDIDAVKKCFDKHFSQLMPQCLTLTHPTRDMNHRQDSILVPL